LRSLPDRNEISGTVIREQGAIMTTPDPLTDPTAWFEHRYQTASVPWDRGAPPQLLVEWTRGMDGTGLRAIVVGCGFGWDAELAANLGFDTVAFDASPTAIRTARERFPSSKVTYLTADLLNLPTAWHGSFDLVIEIRTIQSLPLHMRQDAITHVRELVAPNGTLFVLAGLRPDNEPLTEGPPWLLTHAEVTSFADETLALQDLGATNDPDRPEWRRWRAVFRRA
jgi:2-polyprenyl-3-methyl-5-hydroxy-6-metoxy-1,4-benzoquinol methylase